MAVQFHNAPSVSSVQRDTTVNAGQSGKDRQSASEYYSRPQTRYATDSLQFGKDVTKQLNPAVKPAPAAARQSWQPNPIVGGIIALAAALVAVYHVGGIELAIVLSMTLLCGLLLYGLGFDLTFKSLRKGQQRGLAATNALVHGPRLRATGPLSL